MKEVILLGSDFLFNEELGSRLRGTGYNVYTFSNSQELINRLNSETIKVILVILDLNIPDFNIEELAPMLKTRHIPIIAIGAHKDTASLKMAKALNVDLVIVNSQASNSIETYVKSVLSN